MTGIFREGNNENNNFSLEKSREKGGRNELLTNGERDELNVVHSYAVINER